MDISNPIFVKLDPDWQCSWQDSCFCVMVGSALEEGGLFQKDPAAAAVLYREAMKAGNQEAGYYLGHLYEKGIGVEKNLSAAKSAYLHAVKMGNTAAMLALGLLCEDMGQPEQAFRWFKAGHEAKLPDASHHYARCLYMGTGTEQDRDAAFPIFKALANSGYTDAAFYVGLCYEQGCGTPVDYVMAQHFYQVGADAGDPYCWNQLGSLALEGRCGEKDVHKALDCFLQAGKLGFSKAYGNAAWLFQSDAFGTGRDMEKALRLYMMAAENGDENVAQDLQWIEDHLKGESWPEDIMNGIVVIESGVLEEPDNPEKQDGSEDLDNPEEKS